MLAAMVMAVPVARFVVRSPVRQQMPAAEMVKGAVVIAAPTDSRLAVESPAPDALFRTPDGISHEVACTIPVAGLTAVAALDAIDLRAGDTVLIGGAAGGVGVFAVQLAFDERKMIVKVYRHNRALTLVCEF